MTFDNKYWCDDEIKKKNFIQNVEKEYHYAFIKKNDYRSSYENKDNILTEAYHRFVYI